MQKKSFPPVLAIRGARLPGIDEDRGFFLDGHNVMAIKLAT